MNDILLELRDRLREKDNRLAYKGKIIERIEVAMFLWKEKALEYEKKSQLKLQLWAQPSKHIPNWGEANSEDIN